jgi:hypothetical protein
MVKGKTKEYIIKDETIKEIIKVKYNYLSILVMHCLQTTLLIKKAYKDIL